MERQRGSDHANFIVARYVLSGGRGCSAKSHRKLGEEGLGCRAPGWLLQRLTTFRLGWVGLDTGPKAKLVGILPWTQKML